jgi:hypothetical protein
MVLTELRGHPDCMTSPRSRFGSGSTDLWLQGIGLDLEATGGHHDHHGGVDVGNGGDAGGN